MEFNVSSAGLLKGVLDVSKAIPAKTALPILENFLFDLKGNIADMMGEGKEEADFAFGFARGFKAIKMR